MSYPRVNYEMTQADLDAILEACRPTPVMFLSGGTSIGRDQQTNANIAWAALGEKMGFDSLTVRPIDGKDMKHFSAVPRENETQRAERQKHEREVKRRHDLDKIDEEIAELKNRRDILARQSIDTEEPS